MRFEEENEGLAILQVKRNMNDIIKILQSLDVNN